LPHTCGPRKPQPVKAASNDVRYAPQENRPHASIGYVTPDDEHEGRGEAIRQARRDGLAAARETRIAYRRSTTPEENQ
jgi:putative transposase